MKLVEKKLKGKSENNYTKKLSNVPSIIAK